MNGRAESKSGESSADTGIPLLERLFGIDSRSLAAFRVLIGCILLYDLAIRASDLNAMYTDAGMFPRSEIYRRVPSAWNWSFHFGSGGTSYEATLLGLAGVFGLALTLGLETRLATAGSWLLLVSVQHRAPPVISGADILLRMLLFWGIFLPLGRSWSVDQWRGARSGETMARSRTLSFGTAAVLLQMAMMYLFSAVFKTNDDWFAGGVIKATLEHDFYAKPLGEYFLKHGFLLSALTWSVFVLEWVGPFLLFSPKWTGKCRLLAVGGLIAMHLGIALTVEVDLFSPVAIAGLLLFVPASFWEKLRLPVALAPVGEASASAQPLRIGKGEYLRQAICAAAFVCVLGINLSGLRGGEQAGNSATFLRTGLALGQKWNMFDQAPSRDGWYVAKARLRDGTEVDLLRDGGAVTWGRPAMPAQIYRNFRWRKLFREMSYEDAFGYQLFRPAVGDYLAREWNATHRGEKGVSELELIFCIEQGRNGRATRERLLHLEMDQSS